MLAVEMKQLCRINGEAGETATRFMFQPGSFLLSSSLASLERRPLVQALYTVPSWEGAREAVGKGPCWGTRHEEAIMGCALSSRVVKARGWGRAQGPRSTLCSGLHMPLWAFVSPSVKWEQ